MAGISMDFVANVSKFLRGTKDVEDALEDTADSLDDLARDADRAGDKMGDALEDTADSLDDLARDADRAGDKMGDSLTDASKEGERAADKLERKFRDSLDNVADRSKKTGDDVGDNMKKGADKGVDAAAEFKSEAVQNFSEVASSFEGDMTSAVDLVQGTLGGLAGSIPGAGIALAGVGAIAGVVASQWQENTEAVKEDVSAMYDDLLASGLEYLSNDYQQTVYWEILKGESRLISARQLQQIAVYSKATEEEVAMAYAGNVEMMEKVTQGLIDKRKVFQDQLEDETSLNDSAAQSGLGYINDMIDGIQRRGTQIEEETAKINAQRDAWERAAAQRQIDLGREKSGWVDLQTYIDGLTAPTISPTVNLSQAEEELRRWRPTTTITPRLGQAVV